MKLDKKNTVLIGFAFLSICAFWQMYDNLVPLMLTNTFHMNEVFSGAIMAADNVLALFLLPLFGSSRTDDLVIAAHNYESHFGKIGTLALGDEVRFTDMDGIENHYTVSAIEVHDPTDVEAVEHSGHDLVLYTCTYGGKTRIVVFCDRSA